MKKLQGTLHISLEPHGSGSDTRIYEVTFARENGSAWLPPASAREYLRHFYSDWELAEFLTRDVGCDAEEAVSLVHRLRNEGHARVTGLQLEDWKLRGLNLAA